jgi:hypothetical protein
MAKAIKRNFKGGAGDASAIKFTDKDGNESNLQEKLTGLDSNLNSLQDLVNSINETVTYIEENLGTLSTEPYSCSGSFRRSSSGYQAVTQYVQFNKTFAEPPSVQASFTENEDNRFSGLSVSNITTIGCTISAAYAGNGVKYCTIQWVASGLVRKEL